MSITTSYRPCECSCRLEAADVGVKKLQRRSGWAGPRVGRFWLASAVVLSLLAGLLPGVAGASPPQVIHLRAKPRAELSMSRAGV